MIKGFTQGGLDVTESRGFSSQATSPDWVTHLPIRRDLQQQEDPPRPPRPGWSEDRLRVSSSVSFLRPSRSVSPVMADVDEASFSLMSLEDELTCSICLSTFDCPVTTPCGHNFCQDCLLATWKDSYSCPQCRTHFPTKPDLKKNTVLSTVVETFNLRSNKVESSPSTEDQEVQKKDVIRCDACMEAEAAQTCLTCMASYCEEHLRPHRENPVFRVHQLSEPVGDLFERICQDHHKVMELFCSQHGRLICSLCLQQVHKGCSFTSPEEQRNLKESEFRDQVGLLEGKIEKTEMAMLQMNETQNNLKDGASKRKAALAAVYQQIREMLAQEEREAQIIVDRELELGQMKIRELTKRISDNTETMTIARGNIDSLLSQFQTLGFLQASFDLPKVVKFEPHVPRINLDTNQVVATQAFARALKENLTEIFEQPVEARLPIIKPEPNTDVAASDKLQNCGGEEAVPLSEPASTTRTVSQPESVQQRPPEQKRPPRSHSPGRPPVWPYLQPVPVPFFTPMGPQAGWNPSQFAPGPPSDLFRASLIIARQKMMLEQIKSAQRKGSARGPNHTSSSGEHRGAQKSDAGRQTPHAKKSDTSHQTPHGKKSDTSHQTPHTQKSDAGRQTPHGTSFTF
ncbi:hypothetical protein Q5P01_026086 [Channa striata]|uniref:RING-type domain-containing protein n=1 Tax=Channa striata TaxID=64152 RepID=A0AA88IN50_CHASR|nr:hypothetical protein Q5P01_026086 [Channa striata]